MGFAEPPADLTPPAEDVAPPKAFETYIAPPPSRPPTSEPKLTPPPVEAVAPAPAPVAPAPVPPPVAAPVYAADTMMPQAVVQEPVKAPAAPKEPSSNRRFVIPAAIAGGVAVVVVVGALVAGGGGGDDKGAATTAATPAATAAADVPISASGIALKVPAGWSEGGDATAVPGLADGAVTVGGPKGGTIVIGNADKTAANSTLLPDALRTADLPAGTPVDLADGVQALHYENVKIGDETASIFAVPTDKGVATLACVAEAETCTSIASHDADHGGQALPGRPERGLLRRRRAHARQAREAGEVGRVRAQQGR